MGIPDHAEIGFLHDTWVKSSHSNYSREFPGAGLLTAIAPFVNIQFLGSSLTFMMVSRPEFCLFISTHNQAITRTSALSLCISALTGFALTDVLHGLPRIVWS
jgi:hypothetical protein